MSNRRSFIMQTIFGAMVTGFGCRYGYATHVFAKSSMPAPASEVKLPVVVSTWNHGLAANEAAWKSLMGGGSALDAAEHGVMVSEADPAVSSVGLGGLPDASGRVTLDACIMDSKGNAGSVACLENILHPVSVARKVMEKTPHVMLTGKGALQFALDQGFNETDLLTPEAKKAWESWKSSGARYAPAANWENHDTIGLIVLDKNADLAGACTTSGMAFKHPGRVGDSPIIGAGLFVDNKIGAATATGEGEVVMKTLGSFLVVELMRQGFSPADACKMAVQRIAENVPIHPQMQIGYIALNKAGEYGAFALRPGFQAAIKTAGENRLLDVDALINH